MISNTLLFLIIYSFIGWCCETVYCSFGQGHFINRGFLNGPFCPIYGFGAVFVLWGLGFFKGGVLYIFLGGVLITSTLEYITSFIMEKLFKAKWWDYSGKRFNINGRVCLLNSTLFGLLCLVLYFDLHPLIEKLVNIFPNEFKWGFLFAFGLYFIADFAVTLHSVLGIKNKVNAVAIIKNEFLTGYNLLNEKLNLEQIMEKLKEKREDIKIKAIQEKIEKSSVFEKRIMKAFPNMKLNRNNEWLFEMRKHSRKHK